MKLLRVTTVPSSLAILLRRQLLFMQQNGFEVVAISADGKEVAEIVRNEQCKHLVIPMTRTIAPVSDLKAVIRMYKIIRREKPDIVHSHTPKAGIVAMLASYLARVP